MEQINNLEAGCNASDPTEDTERPTTGQNLFNVLMVATPPIRLRILKGFWPPRAWPDGKCCNASDPTEDTESGFVHRKCICSWSVATPPIRLRILKAGSRAKPATCGREVATPPIRLRILKVGNPFGITEAYVRCNASDPTEDTERLVERGASAFSAFVATPPIRLRILKGHVRAVAVLVLGDVATPPIRLRILKEGKSERRGGLLDRCNASDPTEDTERFLNVFLHPFPPLLQRLRSD